ncbi:MAG TPA: hypothetical protein VMV45_06110 [Casimicrobiaceae bacterium]|nr:hypothetical protein [Casimicrobiaceae bacterium]
MVLVDYTEFDMQPVFIAVNEPVLRSKRDALVAFMRAWLQGVRIVNDDPARAARIVWEQFKAQGYDSPESVFKRMLGTLDIKPAYAPNLRDYLNDQAQVLVNQNQIPAIPDWNRILDTSVLAQAMKA